MRFREAGRILCTVSAVAQLALRRTPAILECNQPRIIRIAAPQVELPKLIPYGFLDGSPEQKLRAPKTMKRVVRATVLVSKVVFVAEG